MTLKEKIALIPNKPGSYQFKNADGKIIYVGKAKDLKKRVASYFTGSHDAKTARLVMNIADISYIMTKSELDALLLELNLIKKYNPRYNIMLTDDKTYPYIEITNEMHPKLIITRNVKKQSGRLFGPYPNVKAARETVRILNKIYPLRKCDTLPKQECLYYHIGQCLAPCINPIKKADYKPIIDDIRRFLKGDTKAVIKTLETQMYQASEALEFERANEYKKTIEDIKTTTEKQRINLNDMKDRDVIGYYDDDHLLSIEIFFIRNGKITARHQKLVEIYTDPITSLIDYLSQFYDREAIPKEVFIPESLDDASLQEFLNTKIHIPKRGPKAKLLQLAIDNAKQALLEKRTVIKREYERTIGAIERIGEKLHIPTPHHIEAFDNSNLFGSNAVSSLVVFKDGKPSKNDYRKFKIKKAQTDSDFAMMKEILYRRYYRVLMNDLPKPDLILVDGGKPQLTAAKSILSDFNLDIPLAGLVKDKSHSTNHLLTENFESVPLKTTSDAFHLLTRIQDEAHRFAVNYHKNVRSKGIFNSVLDDIPGIGKKTKEKLLKKYKTIHKMKLVSLEELKALGLTEPQAQNLIYALKKE
ncbi:MAG: excinuclease ABC subunit UvrC [Candidatus Izemoplasma sp.]|nr:excinuclease ABC subunit UvrC [Candidatus Izemoplasma sp.]